MTWPTGFLIRFSRYHRKQPMQSTLVDSFNHIVTDLTDTLRRYHKAGVDTISGAEAKEINAVLDDMLQRLHKQPSLQQPEVPGSLEYIRQALGECTRCALSKTRKSIVFGQGNPQADLMFIGEAPGRDEDATGEPFVGEAGQLLTKIINAIDMERKDVYIANILKCRPPQNRDPVPEEIACCVPFLKKQIEAIQPKVICTLGRISTHVLLDTKEPISRIRGKQFSFGSSILIPTYHPASLLRNAAWKRPVWEDVQLIQRLLNQSSQ